MWSSTLAPEKESTENLYSIPTGNISSGFKELDCRWENGPLHSDEMLLTELLLADGFVMLFILENRLIAEIFKVESDREIITDQWITPELIRPPGSGATISFQWEEGKFKCFRLNGVNVPRSDEADEFVVMSTEADDEVFTESSRITERKLDLRQVPNSSSLSLKQLIQHTIRLEDRLSELRSDRPEVIFDIAALLRTLLTGSKKNGGLVLFIAAEEFRIVPVCYTINGIEEYSEPHPFIDENTVAFQAFGESLPRGQFRTETDLRQLLCQPAIITQQHQIPHWKLIRDVAGSFGSHAETNQAHSILSLINPHDPALNLSMLNDHIRAYGIVTAQIARTVIKHAFSQDSSADQHQKN
jgi:hypothetical protein